MGDKDKPLGRKAYGSIGHMPGSHRGPGDHRASDGQARICAGLARNRRDCVIAIAEEKLDGGHVAVAGVNGAIAQTIRAGYCAGDSRLEQRRLFVPWVYGGRELFAALPVDRERIVPRSGWRRRMGRVTSCATIRSWPSN
ncbi:MAG: hypothetical protein M0Z27_02885 [Thermaerobacter sp.]|nr:hypothetical protein [Thermaerobacter sp.]